MSDNIQKGFRINREISLGDIGTWFGVFIACLGVVWMVAQLNSKVDEHERRITNLEQSTTDIKNHQGTQDTAIAVLQDNARSKYSN